MRVDLLTGATELALRPLGRLVTQPSAQIAESRFSVGVETLDRGMWNFERTLPHLAALGAKAARVQTGWAKCEQERGVYNFAWLDAIVDPLLAAGIRPWFNVGYGNRLYTPGAPHATAVGWTPIGDEAARAGWAAWATALARHFAGRVTHYEIWNEPDITAFWTPYEPSPEAYADLVHLTADALRAGSADVRIIGGATAAALSHRGLEFVRRCFAHGMGDWIDAYSFHQYTPSPEPRHEAILPALRALVHSYRPGLPMWQGESGAPSKGVAGQALADFEWDEPKQAKWDTRRALLDLAAGVDLISFFHAADFEFYIVKNEVVPQQYYFGLVSAPDYQPKPAFYAAQSLCSLFTGAPAARSEVCAASLPAGARLLAFDTDAGMRVAFWQASDLMQPFTASAAKLSLWMPPALAMTRPVLVDPLAQRVYDLPVEAVQDGVHTWQLPLVDWPLILTDRASVDLTEEA